MADYDAPVPKSPEVSAGNADTTVGAAAQRASGAPQSRTVALVAAVAGLIAVVAGILTPFLPVSTSTASITWPQQTGTSASVTAPLVAQTARNVDISIPCRVLSTTPADTSTVVLSTMPAAAVNARDNGLFVVADANGVSVANRNKTLASVPRDALAGCTELRIFSDATTTGAQFVGLPPGPAIAGGGAVGLAEPASNPQIAGIFTDLTPEQLRAAPGVDVRLEIDDRFDSSPSILKWVVMVVGVGAAIVALVAVGRLDRIHGYHRRVGRRLRWRRVLRPGPTDIGVTVTLVVWHFLGAGSPDDGYILNMGRNAADAGYLANYYRFYGIPEAPFDWYYNFLAYWSTISTTGLWMRLPSLFAGLAAWFILSRVLLPRLGGAVRRSQWAMLTGAAVFLAFWLPMCSGLRSEGIIVLGTLATWWAVEVTVSTRRMLPAVIAAFTAALTLALAPHGLVALALLIASARPMLRILVRRRAEDGLLPLLAPLLAGVALVVIIVFRDQTLATVFEALRIRYSVGPTLAWYQELLRYYFLAVNTTDGALARRIPVLLFAVSMFVVLAIMLRRKRIDGLDPGAVWRALGASLLTILFLSFTPTKWTIQFGIFAGLGAALAAVACVAIGQAARRTLRNLSILVAGLLVACAAAAAGKNAWPWPYNFGIAWFDKAPVVAGIQVSTVLLALAVVALLFAIWQHLRMDFVDETGLAHDRGAAPAGWRIGVASAPIAVIAVLIVVSELAVFAKAATSRADTFTMLSANLDSARGNTCAMADSVLVEPDPNRGMLTPADGGTASSTLQGQSQGFRPDGVKPDLTPQAGAQKPGAMNTSADLSKTFIVYGSNPGTTGGVGPRGVNGSTAALPFGLDPATTPVLGSHETNSGQATLTTGWYRLPARDSSPLIVITAAGAVFTLDRDGVPNFGQALEVQFGRESEAGAGSEASGPNVPANGQFEEVGAPAIPIDPERTNRPWRNLRIPMDRVPADATVMRIVARDNNLDPDQWLAVTPPRAPVLQTLQTVVGSTDPVLIDFAAGAVFPCQRPMTAHHGVFDLPQWRILPESWIANSQSKTWMATEDGGLLAPVEALTRPSTLATYLDDDWYREWGNLQRLTPLVPQARPAEVQTGTSTTWGWSRPGPIRVVPEDD
ncbi:arabinosyltransferase domain-containing protein [Gordonia hongkongensis]|uniref:Arabinosyltransferase domain-containing protein n=1 Tax=Gordonia hongkongensis TaxID=1701090 RepID=A0AAX3T984_9ACTN|nr:MULTISPECIES: arabinosyltransferase domain-containing protein [Gordonia]MBN0971066.1 arabinosyltransferase domain-containing protein [Gordonia sp. BP-119]MBN0982354.1 arabinosyltransferase domain-containing protein [Gordonia sp. BP-94]WFP25207.1 arabinosyltransferase domain-containing protein [Gordonia hongkongensis]